MFFPICFKYSLTKKQERMKIRRVFKILMYVSLFMFCHALTAYIFLYVYPNIVKNCEKNALFEYSETNKPNDLSGISLSDYVMSNWICRPKKHANLVNALQANISQSDDSFANTNETLLNNYKCKCYNSSANNITDGNVTFAANYSTVHQCVCNETRQLDNFNIKKIRNETENQNFKFLNTKDLNYTNNDFYFDEADIVNDGYYLQVNACDCGNASKRETAILDGTYFDERCECNCSEIYKTIFNANETKSSSKQQVNNFPYVPECNCSNIPKDMYGMLNDSDILSQKLNNKFLNLNQCVCPEIPEIVDGIATSEITIKNQDDDMKLVTEKEAFDTVNVHFDKGEAVNEKQYLKSDECICSNIPRKGNGNYDETPNIELDVDDKCKCPELLEINNFDLKEANYENAEYDFHISKSEGCECTEIPQITDIFLNVSKLRNKKLGVKTENGECVCSKKEESEDLISNTTTSGSENHIIENHNLEKSLSAANFNVNETENANELQSLKMKKCLCPVTQKTTEAISNDSTKEDEVHKTHDIKFIEEDDCKCTDELLPENYDISAKLAVTEKMINDSLQFQECECPEMSRTMTNGSLIKSYTHGVKNTDGECVCPDKDGMENTYYNRSGVVQKTETVNGDENLFLKEKDLSNSDETGSVKEARVPYADYKR